MNKLFAITLLLSISTSQMTFQQTNLGNDLMQYYILIQNQPITGICSMYITLYEENENFSIEEADGFKLNFIQGSIGQKTKILIPGLYSYSYNSCVSTLEVEIGPIKILHLKANIKVYVDFTGPHLQLFYSQLVSYNEYINTNLIIKTDSQVTSQICNFNIIYTPKDFLIEEDQIIITFPYRDEYATVPSQEYFNFQTPNCRIEYDGYLDDSILCYFLQNQLTITKINSQSIINIIVEGFVNPQNLKEINNIQFEFQRFIKSQYFVLESSVLSYQINTINQDLFAYLIQSDDHINSLNNFHISIKYSDFLYYDSIMIITFPNQFFTIYPTISLSDNLNTNFISNFVDQTLTLSNFISSEGKQSKINLLFQIQNPLISKIYQGLRIKLVWQNYDIAESIPQNIIFSPLTFKSFNMQSSNKILNEQTQLCYTFEFDKSFYENSYLEINFFSNIHFDSLVSITELQNINSNSQIDVEGQSVKIKNIFINSQFDKVAHFCLNGIYNPYYIDQDHESYTFSIMFNDFEQVVNSKKQFLDLQYGYLEMISLKQSQELTNQKENILNLSFKLQTGLLQNDFIIIYFDLNNYALESLLSDNNQITCEINKKQSFCQLQENSLKIQTSTIFQAKQLINIQINNFISNRSLNPINNINIKTFHQIYLIDILPYSPNLSVSKPNKLSYFFVEAIKNQQSQSISIQIRMQFILSLKMTDSITISIPQKINCVNCICQFHDCSISNQKITLNNLYDINKILYIEILSVQITDNSISLSPTSIQVKDQLGFLIYEEQTQSTAQLYQFQSFKLIPEYDFIGISSNYFLQFISSLDINQKDTLILDFDTDFNLNSIQCSQEYQCQLNQNQLKLNFLFQISQNQNIALMIQSVINPSSLNSLYFYTLSQYNENNTLVQQSFIKSDYFKCQFDNCVACYPDYCQQCQKGFLRLSGKCLYDCPEGYIIINESCKKCETTNYCSICSSNNVQQCLQCYDGYFLENNICIKIDLINHLNTTSPNQNNSLQNSTSKNNTNVLTQNQLVKKNIKNTYSLGLLNYLEAGFACTLILYKLANKNFQMFFTLSIMLGFSIPIFRIFSLVFFTIQEQYIYSIFTLVLLFLSQLQSFHFQAQIEIPLLTDIQYKHNVQKQNYFYINNLLFKFLDFRIICMLKSRLAQSNLFNFSFKYNQEIKIALVTNYKRLITVQNPLQFVLLLTAIIIYETNNYQFEFLIYSSVEWLANVIVLYQLKKNQF